MTNKIKTINNNNNSQGKPNDFLTDFYHKLCYITHYIVNQGPHVKNVIITVMITIDERTNDVNTF